MSENDLIDHQPAQAALIPNDEIENEVKKPSEKPKSKTKLVKKTIGK